jgi:SNF2 family DNA or RNA helicase
MINPDAGEEKRGLLSQLYLDTGRAKLRAIKEYVHSLLNTHPHIKVLVFLHHLELMDQLEESFLTTNTPHIRIDGLTDPNERVLRVDRFQRHAHIRVAMLSLTCGTHGFNLTHANRIVFGELYWTPGILLQAEDRAHRIGQSEEIEVHYLLAKYTLDDIIWYLIN